MLAGGVESMSRVPMGSDGGAWAMDPETSYSTGFVPQGIGADLIATLEGFTREDVDTFARRVADPRGQGMGQRLLRAAPSCRCTDRNGLPVLDRDEHIRAGTTLESLAGLPAVVRDDGRGGRLRRRRAAALPLGREDRPRAHPRATRSGIVDGAALVAGRHAKRRARPPGSPRAPGSWPPRCPAPTRRSCSPAPPPPPARRWPRPA